MIHHHIESIPHPFLRQAALMVAAAVAAVAAGIIAAQAGGFIVLAVAVFCFGT